MARSSSEFMHSIVSERKAEHEIALVLVRAKQGGYGIAEIFRSPACVSKFRSHSQPSGLKFDTGAEGSTDIGIFVKLGNRAHVRANRGGSAPDLIHTGDM